MESNKIYKILLSETVLSTEPINIAQLDNPFFEKTELTNDIIIVKSYERGLAIVEHNKYNNKVKVHFYNEKNDQFTFNIYTAENITKIDTLNENMFKEYKLAFYVTDNVGSKQLAVINLTDGSENYKRITPEIKNFDLICKKVIEEGFSHTVYTNNKMRGKVNRQIIDFRSNIIFSQFIRHYLKQQTLYTILDNYDKQLVKQILVKLNDDEFERTTLIIDDTDVLLKLLPCLNEHTNIQTIILKNLHKIPIEELQTAIKANLLQTNVQFLFVDNHVNMPEHFSRIILSMLRDNNTLGEFYYTEYDDNSPEAFYVALFNMESD